MQDPAQDTEDYDTGLTEVWAPAPGVTPAWHGSHQFCLLPS